MTQSSPNILFFADTRSDCTSGKLGEKKGRIQRKTLQRRVFLFSFGRTLKCRRVHSLNLLKYIDNYGSRRSSFLEFTRVEAGYHEHVDQII